MKVLAALALTPWAIFITSTSAVYLQNQEEFDYEYQVYGTLFLVASLVTVAGFLLCKASKNSTALRSLLAAYYVFGPAFLIYNALSHQNWMPLWDIVLVAVIFVAGVALTFFLRSRINSETFVNVYSFFFLVMVTTDATIFATRFEAPPPDVTRDHTWYQTKNPETTLPNIYHFLFDSYQTDYFLNSLKEDSETDAFDGFLLFENNYSVFELTRDSLVSIFSSALPTNYPNEKEYRLAAFQGQGLVFGLNNRGYKTICLNCGRSHRRVEDGPHRFELISLRPTVPSKVLVDNSFYEYWFESYFPEFLTAPFQQDKGQIPTQEQFRLKKSRPIAHYQAYKEFLDLEPKLSAKNRYTFLHLLIPHDPYVLRKDCSFSGDLQATGRLEQTGCAYSMVKGLIDLLKQLGRFDDSVIVIHADHGFRDSGSEIADKLRPLVVDSKDVTVPVAVELLARRRALLLIKPAGESAPDEFIKHQGYTSLLDLGPTIYGMAAISIPKHFQGRDISKWSRIKEANPNVDRKFLIFDDRHNNAAYQIETGTMKSLGDAKEGYSSELK